MLNLEQLQELGAFVSEELVKRQITFKLREDAEEQTFDIFVRRLSIGHHEKMWKGAKEDASVTAKLLSESVRLGEEGKQAMSYDQAFALNPNLALAMAEAVNEVNGGGRKNSAPPTN